MAKSRFLGNSSSTRDVNESGIARLKSLASSEKIQILSKALGADAGLHLVGGVVRDLLVTDRKSDIDLATALHPSIIQSLLNENKIRVVETGIAHGTLTAVIHGENIEITTYRLPGSRNVFHFSDSIEKDLGGRDFTINAIAFSIKDHTLVDPFSGVTDLKLQVLKAVGHAEERFKEDPLRILRMIRFGPAEGRTVDSATQEAARSNVSLLSKVSIERIKSELEKILMSAHPKAAFRLIRDIGALPFTLPEMEASIGFEQNEFHTEDVFEHTLSVIEQSIPDRVVRWACLFHDLGKPASTSIGEDGRRHFYSHEVIGKDMCDVAMHRLKFSNDDIDAVKKLVYLHMRPMQCGPAGIRRLIRDLGPLFGAWREVKLADYPPVVDLKEFKAQVALFDAMVEEERNRKIGSPFDALAIDGNDLIKLGMKEGPALGKILKNLLDLITDSPELNEREELLKRAKTFIVGSTQD